MVAAAVASRSVRVDLVRGDMETPYLDGKAERRWDRSARVGRLLDVSQGAGEFIGCGSARLIRDQRVTAGAAGTFESSVTRCPSVLPTDLWPTTRGCPK